MLEISERCSITKTWICWRIVRRNCRFQQRFTSSSHCLYSEPSWCARHICPRSHLWPPGRRTGQNFCICDSNSPLHPPTSLMFLNAPIVSADGDIVDLLGGASLFIVIEMTQFTWQPDKETCHMLCCHLCSLAKNLHVVLDGRWLLIPKARPRPRPELV